MTIDQAKLIAKKVRTTLERERRAPKSTKYPIYLSRSGMSRTVKFWKKPFEANQYSQQTGFAIVVEDEGMCYCNSSTGSKWVYHNLLKHKPCYPLSFTLSAQECEFHLDPIDPPRLRDLPETIQQLLVNKSQ